MAGVKKQKDKVRRTEWLHIRLTQDEYNKISDDHKKTTSRELSAFARKRLLEKPVTYYTRNQTIDEGLRELTLLRNELSAIGSNFNQMVKKLNSFTSTPGLLMMTEGYNLVKNQLDVKMEDIRKRINQLAEKWLRESTLEKTSGGR